MDSCVAVSFAQTAFWAAGAVSFLVAAVTGLVAFLRYRKEADAKDWERAHGAYERFLAVALDHAEFTGRYWSSEAGQDAANRTKFRWYMARFLWAAEQALKSVPEREQRDWKRAIKIVLREHADFLSDPQIAPEVDCYSEPLRQLIHEIVGKHTTAPSQTT